MDKSNMLLLQKNATTPELECAICYKAITKMFFECSKPCQKVFHPSCMEKSMNQTEEVAYEMDDVADHKCCYCRRAIDANRYFLQLFARHLITLRAGGYEVTDALAQVRYDFRHISDGEQDNNGEYEIYVIQNINYSIKSIQPNYFRKKTKQHKPRIITKQNIGGRRR
jgi:hypothetical protein